VFSLAILCMIGLGATLNINYRDMLHHWTEEDVRPTPPPRAPRER